MEQTILGFISSAEKQQIFSNLLSLHLISISVSNLPCNVCNVCYGASYSLLFTCFCRTACVIAVAKARDTFEPFLHQVIYYFLLLSWMIEINLTN